MTKTSQPAPAPQPPVQETTDETPRPTTPTVPATNSPSGVETGWSGASLATLTGGDQPSLIGEAGIPELSPIQSVRQEVDVLLAALKQVFGSRPGEGVVFEMAERKIRHIRAKSE